MEVRSRSGRPGKRSTFKVDILHEGYLFDAAHHEKFNGGLIYEVNTSKRKKIEFKCLSSLILIFFSHNFAENGASKLKFSILIAG